MKALVVTDLGGPEAAEFAEIPEPTGAHPRAGGRRVLVDVHAAGISFIDPLQTRGKYQNGVPTPFVSGSELSGVVLEAPPDSFVQPGDRVAGTVWQGALAERALAIEDYLIKLPSTMSFVEGAGLYMNYSTAWFALTAARLEPGDVVLVQGAGGGVGMSVIDLAATFGVRVIAVVSSQEKAALVAEAGADHVLRTDSAWLDGVRNLTDGRGVTAFVDMVGGETFMDTLRSLRIGGRGIVVGFASGNIPSVPINRLILRSTSLVGVAIDELEKEYPGTLSEVRTAVQELADRGAIRPRIGRVFDFLDARSALSSVETRSSAAKVVVAIK